MRTEADTDLLSLVWCAQSGDAERRNDLIRRYEPFVLGVVSRMLGRYVRAGRDDEASVGLIAFNEAIDSYDPGRGARFLPFAETVIRRRLIDHLRKGSGKVVEIPFSSLASDHDVNGNAHGVDDVQIRAATREYSMRTEEAERRDEIVQFAKKLLEYGISLSDLPQISPRHEDARRNAISAARIIARTEELREHLRTKHELPLGELAKRAAVSRKTLERQRKYIIAIAVILLEDYEHLKEYVDK